MEFIDVTPTDSTFHDMKQLPCNGTQNYSSAILLFEVKGHGVLRLLSCDDKSGKTDSHNIEVEMSLKMQHLPIIFHIPNDEKFANIQIQRQGQIDVKLNGSECNPVDVKEVIDIDKVDNCISIETNNVIHDCTGSARGHRRNNSSHLFVSGATATYLETENNISRHDHTDTSHIEELDNTHYKAPSDSCNVPKEHEDESSIIPDEQLSMLSSLDSKSKFATDNVVNEIAKGILDTNQEQVAQHCGHNTVCNSRHAEHSEIHDIQNQIDTQTAVNDNIGPRESRNGNTTVRDKVQRNRKTGAITECDNILRENVQMDSAIQASYTHLLDMIDLMDLCDHLYQNCVLDIGIYETLFSMSYERVHLRNATRTLLLYLSKRQVKKASMIKSLVGSAHYQLISCFFPSEKNVA